MAIEFSCQCGKQIKVAEKFAGRRAKCPACGEAVTIPAPDAPDDEIDGNLLYEAIGDASGAPDPVQCPNCDRPMAANATVCGHCGYNRIARTHVQLAQADMAPKRRDPMAPLLTLAGIDITWLRLIIILVPLIGFPIWYYTGPGADLHINEMQTVNVVWTIKGGKTREQFNAGNNAMVNMIRQQHLDEKAVPLTEAGEADYTLGASDELAVCEPDEDGDYVLLRVSLRQLTIRDAGRTSLYDTIIKDEDFTLVPPDGGPPVQAKFIYYQFEGDRAEIDIAGADTSGYEALFPTEPTQIEVERGGGLIEGKANWNQHNAIGEITFSSMYSTGDYPSPKGVSADGRLELYNDRGATVDMHYKGSTLDVAWDHGSSGYWTKQRYEEPSHDWPWHRYEFGLLFERPQVAGRYDLKYCGKTVASFRLDELPGLKLPPLSPLKQANLPPGQNPIATSNNPLVYFDILIHAREQARGIVSANNLRQIGLGLAMYLDQNNQQWPERLDQLKSIIDDYDRLMINPRTNANPGFIYVKPDPGADPATTAVVYESAYGKPDLDGAVLYADGHIQ